jgi:hypothetical protein
MAVRPKKAIRAHIEELEAELGLALWPEFVAKRDGLKVDAPELSPAERWNAAYEHILELRAPGVPAVPESIPQNSSRAQRAAAHAERKKAAKPKKAPPVSEPDDSPPAGEPRVADATLDGHDYTGMRPKIVYEPSMDSPSPAPAPSPEKPASKAKPKTFASMDDDERRAMLDGRRKGPLADIRWVAGQLAYKEPDFASAPSAAAVALWAWVVRSGANQTEFWKTMYVKTLPSRTATENEARAREDAARIDELTAGAITTVERLSNEATEADGAVDAAGTDDGAGADSDVGPRAEFVAGVGAVCAGDVPGACADADEAGGGGAPDGGYEAEGIEARKRDSGAAVAGQREGGEGLGGEHGCAEFGVAEVTV